MAKVKVVVGAKIAVLSVILAMRGGYSTAILAHAKSLLNRLDHAERTKNLPASFISSTSLHHVYL